MLNASYEAILSELLSEEVRFLVIGGYAMAALGLPRFTDGLDVWVHSESQNIKRLYRALRNAHVPMESVCEDDLLSAYNFLEIGQAPVKVDIITNLGDFSFDRAWSNRFYVESGGIEIPFIGIREFVAIKRFAGRTVDLQDIDRLIEMGLFSADDED
jgi:predicted nucleotidyltransferase